MPDSSLIEVAVALPVSGTFTYQISENLGDTISIGKRVLVSFGRRRVTGYVLGPGNSCEHKDIKRVETVLDLRPLFPADLVPFFRWISDYYLHPIGEVIKSALPGGLNLYEHSVFELTAKGKQVLQTTGAGDPLNAVLKLLEKGAARVRDLNRVLKKNNTMAVLSDAVRAGWVCQKSELRGARTKALLEPFVSLQRQGMPPGRISEQRRKIIETLSSEHEMSLKNLKSLVPNASSLVRSLQKAGHVHIAYKQVFRDPLGEPILPDQAPMLTSEQETVLEKLLASLDHGFLTFLLAGVTGSGKTEIYLQLADAVLSRGRTALVLVPEIVLISQMERRFRARFGQRVAVLHSGLSPGERLDQ